MSVSVDVGVMWRLSEDFNRRFGLRMQPAPPVGQHPHPHHGAVHHHYHHHHQHHQHPHTSMIFNGKSAEIHRNFRWANASRQAKKERHEEIAQWQPLDLWHFRRAVAGPLEI